VLAADRETANTMMMMSILLVGMNSSNDRRKSRFFVEFVRIADVSHGSLGEAACAPVWKGEKA
jgi:hypothetical protein